MGIVSLRPPEGFHSISVHKSLFLYCPDSLMLEDHIKITADIWGQKKNSNVNTRKPFVKSES